MAKGRVIGQIRRRKGYFYWVDSQAESMRPAEASLRGGRGVDRLGSRSQLPIHPRKDSYPHHAMPWNSPMGTPKNRRKKKLKVVARRKSPKATLIFAAFLCLLILALWLIYGGGFP